MRNFLLLPLSILTFTMAFCLQVFPQGAPGPDDPSHADLTSLKRQGSLVSLELVPSDKRLKIHVVGKTKATVDLKQFKLFVKQISPHARPLAVGNPDQDGFYTIGEPFDPDEPTELEVKTQSSGKEESFRFKLHNKP